MNAVTPTDLEAADMLALARLDDDGAPPASPPQARDGHPLAAAETTYPRPREK